METTPENDWFERVPKVELHLHLEGAIPLDTLWALVQKYGGDPTLPDVDALKRRFAYRDFPHFIETWIWKNQFLREYEDFTFFAEAFARDLARQNIRYAEVFFSPLDFARYGLKVQGLAAAIRKGLARVPGTEIQLIIDFGRDWGPAKAAVALAEIAEVRDQGVIGIGIGGSEQKFPPEPFQQVYEAARRFGFHTTAHAGEAAGAESVWGAIRALQVERIGHGARAGEDARLLDTLAESANPHRNVPAFQRPHRRRAVYRGAPHPALLRARAGGHRQHRRPQNVWQQPGGRIPAAGSAPGLHPRRNPRADPARHPLKLAARRAQTASGG